VGRRRVDPLAALVAACIVALALYGALLPPLEVFVPEGTVLTWSGGPDVGSINFTVRGEGGRLVGSFVSTGQTSPWIHPSSDTSIPRGPLGGVCGGGFDFIFPPDHYTITFFSPGPVTLRVTEAIGVVPVHAPEGTPQYAGLASATSCPLGVGT